MTAKERQLQRELVETGRILEERDLIHTILGTISVLYDRALGICLAKPATLHYRKARVGDFVKVDMAGKPLEPGQVGPSLNFLVHAACYAKRPDIGAIIHAHPEDVVALISGRSPESEDGEVGADVDGRFRILTGEAIWFLKPSPKRTLEIPVVDDLPPHLLKDAVAARINECDVVAIRNHGTIAVGQTLEDALNATIAANVEARILCKILAIGKVPRYTPLAGIKKEIASLPWYIHPPFEGRS